MTELDMSSIEHVNDTFKRLVVNFPKDEVVKEINTTTQMYANDAEIKGFRKGKAPATLVKKAFYNKIVSSTIDSLANKTFKKFSEKIEDQIISAPSVDISSEFNEEKDLSLVFTFNMIQNYTLGNYKNFTLKVNPANIPSLEKFKEDEFKTLVNFYNEDIKKDKIEEPKQDASEDAATTLDNQEITITNYADVTDDIAKKLHFKDAEDFQKNFTELIENKRKGHLASLTMKQIFKHLCTLFPYQFGPEILDSFIEKMKKADPKLSSKIAQDTQYLEILKKNIQIQLSGIEIIGKIAKVENITVTEKDVLNEISTLVMSGQIPVDQFYPLIQNENVIENFRKHILSAKVCHFVLDNSEIVYEEGFEDKTPTEYDPFAINM